MAGADNAGMLLQLSVLFERTAEPRGVDSCQGRPSGAESGACCACIVGECCWGQVSEARQGHSKGTAPSLLFNCPSRLLASAVSFAKTSNASPPVSVCFVTHLPALQ